MKYEVLTNYGFGINNVYFGLSAEDAIADLRASRIFQQFAKVINSPTQNTQDFARHALKEAHKIIKENPENPLYNYLAGFGSFGCGNITACRMLVARSVVLDEGFSVARKTLASLFPEGEGEKAAEKLLEEVRLGFDHMIEEKTSQAREFFEQGNLVQADHYIQIVNCLKFPGMSGPGDYEFCLKEAKRLQEAGEYEQALNDLAKEKLFDYEHNWEEGKDFFIDLHKDTLSDVNKVDFCKIIHDTLSALPQDNLVCVDFGCYIGAMLKIIYDLFPPEKRQQVSFHGIDPDRNGIGYCRQNYPFIQAHQGSHEELVNGRLELPEEIDVVYSNATLGIMAPKAVEQFIEGFAGRTRYFVIGDDIINLNGDFPLIRQGVQRFMHNYGTILKRFGYSVENLIFPPTPMRYLSGIIIAERDG